MTYANLVDTVEPLIDQIWSNYFYNIVNGHALNSIFDIVTARERVVTT